MDFFNVSLIISIASKIGIQKGIEKKMMCAFGTNFFKEITRKTFRYLNIFPEGSQIYNRCGLLPHLWATLKLNYKLK